MALQDNVVFAHFGDALGEDYPGGSTQSNPSGLNDPSASAGELVFAGSEGITFDLGAGAWNPGSGDWTLAVRATIDDLSTFGQANVLLHMGSSSSFQSHVMLWEFDPASRYMGAAYSFGETNDNIRTTANFVTEGSPFVMAIVCESGVVTIYDGSGNDVTGARNGAFNTGPTLTSGQYATIGSEQDGSRPLTGSVEWAVAWDRALTPTELSNNLNETDLKAALGGGGTPDPTLTDVDTDETVTSDQTGVSVTGADMGSTNADRTFDLVQGAVAVEQTETGTGTATAATLSIDIDDTADIKFGAATLRVTRTSDSATGELAVTVNPPTGQLYVDVGTPDATASNRITATPDIESGDQIQARGVGGGAAPTGLSLNSDATFEFSSGNTPTDFDVRIWDVNDATWGAWATQSVGGSTVSGSLSEASQHSAAFSAIQTHEAAYSQAVQAAAAFSFASIIEAACTQTLTAGDALSADTVLEAAYTQAMTLDASAAAVATMGAALSEGMSLSAALAGGQIVEAAYSQGLTLADAVDYDTAIEAALTEAISAGMTASSSAVFEASLSQGLVADAVASVIADLNAQITEGAQVGASSTATAVLNDGMTVTVTAGYTAAGVTLSGDVVTPDGRTFTVALESRTFTPDAEDRTFQA